jgi:hypothetical protein
MFVIVYQISIFIIYILAIFGGDVIIGLSKRKDKKIRKGGTDHQRE